MTGNSALEGLYPFLHDKEQDPAARDAGLLHSIEAKARESREANARFFAQQAGVLIDAAKAHAAAYHILWDLVHTLLADNRGSAISKDVAA